ncbi:FMN-binding protein [Subtercola frigoramans]|uniref:Uncharacterized protein with FMN-binding domain n=1 Tax=Subtercola frigoramans TaxID=120298 RepID=A0ABS2L1M4_9MICO|nr:FMN-binding protein [Subtercola frigoramans]MBM7470929.1 uncharacterized protein with FMN-binding domain [Subtercola frigoramans]
MRKRAVFGSVLSSAAVLAAGWQIGVHEQDAAGLASTGASTSSSASAATGTSTGTGAASAAGSAGASSGSASTSATASATPSPSATTAPATAQTYTGSVVNTRFGTIQVSVTVADGTITDVTALKLTDDDNKSVQISARAAPILRSEVLAAQSANVATVSGATYTSDGYLQSLQSALDQAGL